MKFRPARWWTFLFAVRLTELTDFSSSHPNSRTESFCFAPSCIHLWAIATNISQSQLLTLDNPEKRPTNKSGVKRLSLADVHDTTAHPQYNLNLDGCSRHRKSITPMQYEVIRDDRPRRRPRDPEYVIRHTSPPAIRYDDCRLEPIYSRERPQRERHHGYDERSYSPPVRYRSHSHTRAQREVEYSYERRGEDSCVRLPRHASPVFRTRDRSYSPGSYMDDAAMMRNRRRMRRDSSQLQDSLTANIAAFKFQDSSEVSADPMVSASSNALSKDKPHPTPRSGKITHVFRSEYTGEGHLEGNHSVSLMTRSDVEGEKLSLFRWLHVKQDIMNLDAFSSEIQALPDLTTPQRKAITRLLSDVKKNSSNPVRASKGATVRHMDPGVRQLDVIPSPNDDTRATPTPVTWICIPYFSLERYSGLLASSNPGSYPTQTLLQASYARIAYKRDMQQAARQISSGDRGSCFHIPQLWCLVVGDLLLVTCGLMDDVALRDRVVSVQDEIPRAVGSRSLKGARILVRYRDSVAWSIPAEKCETFLSFSAHFHELWPTVLEFYHDGRLMSREAWPDILNLLHRGHGSVTFTMKSKYTPPFQPPPRLHDLQRGPKRAPFDRRSSRNPEAPQANIPGQPSDDRSEAKPEEKGTERAKTPAQNPNEVFHVFSWIKTKTSSAADPPNTSAMKNRLDQVAELLSGAANAAGSKAFKAGRTAEREAAHALVDNLVKTATDTGTRGGRPDRRLAGGIRLFNTADVIYNFFFPKRTEDTTVLKYWGSIFGLTMEYEKPRQGRQDRRAVGDTVHPNLEMVQGRLQDVIPNILAFKQIMAQATESDRAKIQVPEDLTRAWPLIVMALIHSCVGTQETGPWTEQLTFATSLIRSGMTDLIDSLSSCKLADHVTIQPMDLIPLMSMRLLSDTTGKNPSTSETYLEYLQSLEAQITSMPSDRLYETRINHVQEEVSIIRKIVDAQRSIYGFISRTRNAGELTTPLHHARPFEPYGGYTRSRPRQNPFGAPGDGDDMLLQVPLFELSPARDLLVWECIDLLERRKKEFQGYDLHAQSLERLNASKVVDTKDKQEQAIYIFTLVTIIFLPLSAVSSIFGMNTSDVRDMESGMWVYWAVAIPVTLLVILLGLWWLGELGKLTEWGLRKMRGQDGLSDEIPPPPYPGPRLSPTMVPERGVDRVRSGYRERHHRAPSPDSDSDYGRREDRRRRAEERLVREKLELELAEHKRRFEEERRAEKLKLEEETAKLRAEARHMRREMEEKRAAENAPPIDLRRARAERDMERHRAEQREKNLAGESTRRLDEQQTDRWRDRRDDGDEGMGKRTPYRDQTVEEYD